MKRGLIVCILFCLFLICSVGIAKAETTPPNITFILQNPFDISTLNLYSSGFNVTYNITDATGVNASTVFMYYKTNSSSSNVQRYINRTQYSGFFSHSGTNESINWTFKLDDNDVYPGIFNLDQDVFENTAHSSLSIGSNDAAKIEFLNVSNMAEYNIFEFMANSTLAANSLFVFYCNSSYSTGNIVTNNNCFQFGSISGTPKFNITNPRLNNSRYQMMPLTINTTTGMIGTVKVTTLSYFILRKSSGGSWNVYYIFDTARPTTTQTTVNNGGGWTSRTYTFDAHLHQYNGADSFYYDVCANDTSSPVNSGCSETKTDLISLGGLPPSAPHVSNPVGQAYAGNISINYTQAVSPNGYPIIFYNITLANTDETYNKTIQSNNSLNLSYIWNSVGTPDGEYLIKVLATDNQSLTSFDFSENFTIDNTAPTINVISPLAQNYTTSQILVNFSSSDIHAASSWYNNGTANITYSSPITLTLADSNYNFTFYANDTAGNVNSTSVTFGVDSNSPSISIISPLPILYNYNSSINLNVTTTDIHLDYCWWNLDSGTNNSIACNQNITFNTSEAPHTLYYYSNDTFGNSNSASVSFDIDFNLPSVTLIYPGAGRIQNASSISFNFSATDTHTLSVCQLWGNFSGIWQINQTLVSPSKNTNINFSSITLNDGSYLWNVWCNESNNDYSFSLFNRTFMIDTKNPQIDFGSGTENQSISNRSGIFINISAADTNLVNITFYLFDSNGLVNSTTTSENSINFTSLPDEIYYFNVTAVDRAGNSNHTQTRNITLDSTAPVIEVITPDDNYYNLSESVSLNFSFNVTDNNIQECVLVINGSENFSIVNQTVISNPNNINKTLLFGDYSWKITCSDLAGNGAESTLRTVTINWSENQNQDSSQPTSAARGGGSYPTFYPKDIDLENGYNRGLYKNWMIQFDVGNQTHILSLDNVQNQNATITVSSTPKTKVLSVGEEWKVELTGDSLNDISVRLNSILGNLANISIQYINNSVVIPEIVQQQNNVSNNSNGGVILLQFPQVNLKFIAVITTLFILILGFVVFFIHKYYRKKRSS